MKLRGLLSFALLSSVIVVLGQTKVEQTQFNLSKMNVMYTNVPNPIIIYDFPVGGILVGQGFNVMKTRHPKQFMVRPVKPSKKAHLYVLNSQKDTVSSFFVRVLRLPNPDVSFLGMKEGLISKSKLTQGIKLNAEVDIAYSMKVKVHSFSVTAVSADNKNTQTINGKGNKITADMKTLFSQAQRGTRIYFENIKVKYPDGKTRKCPSIIFKVK